MPNQLLKVTFAGEAAIDDGGPRREFFTGKYTTYFYFIGVLNST